MYTDHTYYSNITLWRCGHYRYRVLGVSELARQLEEKKEQIDVMKQKISRLEITLVRVENRASSLEKKLKNSNGSVTADGTKTTHIPGPSKQILDTLLAENNKLKTALNNLTNRGHSGYVTAVVSYYDHLICCEMCLCRKLTSWKE